MPDDASPPSGRSEQPEGRGIGPIPPLVLGLLYLLGTAVLVGLLVTLPTSTAKSVPYSDFLQMVRAGQVAEVVIDAHRIRGTIKGSTQPFETTRIEDPHLGTVNHRVEQRLLAFARQARAFRAAVEETKK